MQPLRTPVAILAIWLSAGWLTGAGASTTQGSSTARQYQFESRIEDGPGDLHGSTVGRITVMREGDRRAVYVEDTPLQPGCGSITAVGIYLATGVTRIEQVLKHRGVGGGSMGDDDIGTSLCRLSTEQFHSLIAKGTVLTKAFIEAAVAGHDTVDIDFNVDFIVLLVTSVAERTTDTGTSRAALQRQADLLSDMLVEHFKIPSTRLIPS